MTNKKIPFNKPFIIGKELDNIAHAVINGQLAGDGSYTQACNTWLEFNLKCEKALLTHSCTAALEICAILCDIQPGDEIIMPSFTFASTANAFVLRGGVPVFVDIHRDTLNIDERLIKDAITTKTKAIVPVHYAGVACAMDEIMDLADRYKLWVIEDAAQALLSTYNGKHLGTIGHLGCLSFHETKNIISGEGGALLVNDGRLTDRAEIIREKGTNRSQFFRRQVDKYTWVDIGSSYLPSELMAAFLYAQFEHANNIITTRKHIVERYMKGLKPLADKGLLQLPLIPNGNACNGHMFYIITNSHDERTKIIDQLMVQGINAVFHYVPLHSSPAGKKYGRQNHSLSVTDEVSDRLLRLPMYYEMTDEDVDRVVEGLHHCLR